MQPRPQKIPTSDQLREALADIGGEPLEGSGFEQEMPDSEFSDTAPVAAELRQ